jgi:hypothetical protein
MNKRSHLAEGSLYGTVEVEYTECEYVDCYLFEYKECGVCGLLSG